MRNKVHTATVYSLKPSAKVRPIKAHPAKTIPVKVHSIKNYEFSQPQSFFFDTNIWLYIYGPISWQDPRSEIYSSALKKIRASNGSIYINCMIISEFINAFSRIEFRQQSQFSRYKDFRNSPGFRAVAQDIAYNVRKILKNTLACDSDFVAINLPEIIDIFEQGKYDFNDLVFAEVCRSKEMIFVTHDKDFSDMGVEVLTANGRLLGETED